MRNVNVGMARTIGGLGAILLLSCAAGASLMNDPYGMDGGVSTQWQGRTHFQSSPAYVSLDIEFSVYAPGQFDASFGLGSDPSGGSDYVYAYQIHNNLQPKNSRDYIKIFTVGFSGGNEVPMGIGSLAGPDRNPDAVMFSPVPPAVAQSAVWQFNTGNVLAWNEISDVLYYASPFGPEMDNASVTGRYGVFNQQQLPSPTPEPATIVFLVAGMIAACRRRKMAI